VLGNDVLKIDLSDVDPRRLARGEWEEVVYIGILLIRVAKDVGMLDADAFDIIDLDPDATSSQINSQAASDSFVSSPVSRSPPRLPPRSLQRKGAHASVHTTHFSSPLSLATDGETSLGSRKRPPRPPEKESTPPPSTRKPTYMTLRHPSSPPKPTHIESYESSICSCDFVEDMTVSTVNCYCEIHGPEVGQSVLGPNVDDARLSLRTKR